jgi:hypothetical protein
MIRSLCSISRRLIRDFCFALRTIFNLNAEKVSSLWDDEDDEKLLKKSEMTAARQKGRYDGEDEKRYYEDALMGQSSPA